MGDSVSLLHVINGSGVNYPMFYVSWYDCQEFINELNSIDTEHIYRLPSESEWEYACRAGTTTRFYWGDSNSESAVGNYCWYRFNSSSSTHPVATKLPNAWGLYDMSGNVYEWCEDTWHSSYEGAPTDGSAWVSSGGYSRVRRGGCWKDYTRNCCAAGRSLHIDFYGLNDVGLRLARSVR